MTAAGSVQERPVLSDAGGDRRTVFDDLADWASRVPWLWPALLSHLADVNAWWLLPLCVFAALGWSLHQAAGTPKNSASKNHR